MFVPDVAALLAAAMQRPAPAVASSMAFSEIEGWDSVMTVRLMLLLEQALGRELAESELEAIETVGNVEALIGRSQARE
jgi:acyl carrier protein